MNKTYIIKQPAGIGDIIFCQKIAKNFAEDGNRVIWIVSPSYFYIKDYLIGDIEYYSESEDFPHKDIYNSQNSTEDILVVDLQSADAFIRSCHCHRNSLAHGHMKYNRLGISYHDWQDYFEFKRNAERENRLIEKLGIDISKPYNIINNNFGTYPNYLSRNDIYTLNGFSNIYMEFIEGTHIFDWLKILENAQEIHTVETSFVYLLEKLDINNVSVYSRYPGINDDFSYMKDNFKSKWRYIP
jgi:hypothetical protein